MLGGVCAGIANRFDLDPTIVRVAVIALGVITAGTTILLYLALWIIIPAGPAADTRRPSKDQLAGEFRGAGERVAEAGRIVGRAAKQAAEDISALQRRPAPASVPDVAAAGAEPEGDEGQPGVSPETRAPETEAPGTETTAPSATDTAVPPVSDATEPPPAPQAPPSPPPGPLPGPWGDQPRQQP